MTIQQGTGTLQGLRTLVAGQAQFIFNDIGSMIVLREGECAHPCARLHVQKAPHTLFSSKSRGIAKPKDFEGQESPSRPATRRG